MGSSSGNISVLHLKKKLFSCNFSLTDAGAYNDGSFWIVRCPAGVRRHRPNAGWPEAFPPLPHKPRSCPKINTRQRNMKTNTQTSDIKFSVGHINSYNLLQVQNLVPLRSFSCLDKHRLNVIVGEYVCAGLCASWFALSFAPTQEEGCIC